MIEEEARPTQSLMSSPEAREAFTAFLEKRPPDFAKARQGRLRGIRPISDQRAGPSAATTAAPWSRRRT